MLTTPEIIKQRINANMPVLQREYQRGINRDLSLHRVTGALERQLLETIDRFLSHCQDAIAGDILQAQPLSESIPIVDLQLFLAEKKDQLIAYALTYNRSSCALSNFPDEHAPGPDYLTQILSKIEIRWCQWCAANGFKD